MTNRDITALDAQYVAGTYKRFPPALVRGEGSLLWDADGRQYIDLASGIAVNAFGAADPAWTAAVTAQLQTLQHASNLFYTKPCAELAALLCQKTGMKKVFFSNSGAEANECAVKVARKYAAQRKGPEYNVVLTLKNSFHGRTLTTLAATGQDAFHKDFLPLTPGFAYVAANDPEDLAKKTASCKAAAILFEPVQGEGGVLPLTREFAQAIAETAKKHDLLVMADEVQTGNGRSGTLYAYMQYGLTPDVVSTAKGLAGGLPLGATLLGERVENVLGPGDHGSTFGGNPVCCAAALNVLGRIDEALLAGVRRRSDYIRARLNACPGVESVTGLGLMLGVQTKKDPDAVLEEARENGVLVIKAKQKLRLLPALNIPEELLARAMDVLTAACG